MNIGICYRTFTATSLCDNCPNDYDCMDCDGLKTTTYYIYRECSSFDFIESPSEDGCFEYTAIIGELIITDDFDLCRNRIVTAFAGRTEIIKIQKDGQLFFDTARDRHI